jgi:hypothetical protein
MPVATIKTLYCVNAATGTDSGVNQAIAALPAQIFPEGSDVATAIRNAVAAIPGLIETIDAARQDPDDLYVTVGSARGRDNAVWPGPGRDLPTNSGQSQHIGLAFEFQDTMDISLWDEDVWSTDLLGSVTATADEIGGGDQYKFATNPVEHSAYVVVYRVD